MADFTELERKVNWVKQCPVEAAELIILLETQSGLMAEKAAEKEQAFGQFMQIIEDQKSDLALYKLQETRLLVQLAIKDQEIKKLKSSTRFRVFQENLSLAEENARLKELAKV
ncbi:hypothetical protein [Neobacillus vireti]|uniref:hypothetical protein n=1 Tax=Neobacillus vireti TaxID=220686 RepID=UPI002FFD6021